MHVVGGLYHEVCLRPAWNAVFGSGGRAALTLAELADETALHGYFEDPESSALDPYRDHDVQLLLTKRDHGVAFAYFHPLSTPHLQPLAPIQHEPLIVHGRAVLRFGLVEGDAIVSAKRAVFDPQGTLNTQEFLANGSSAEQLALVLNEVELRVLANGRTFVEAGRELIRQKKANVVVIKRGIRGATVIDELERHFEIPPFRSPAVFKIGTGDVFSALFALFWADQGYEPREAAFRASAGVANYANTKCLPLRSTTLDYDALIGRSMGSVKVIGAQNTLGRHYVLEEAKHRLRELGVAVHGDCTTGKNNELSVILILADGLNPGTIQAALALHQDNPTVLLDEAQLFDARKCLHIDSIVNDFTTALYHAAWATMQRRPGKTK